MSTREIIYATAGNAGETYWIDKSVAVSGKNVYSDGEPSCAIYGANNIYFGGYANSYSDSSRFSATLIKYNSLGVVQWIRSLRETFYGVFGYSTATDSSGNVYICGHNTDAALVTSIAIVAKYDSSGNLQWQKKYDTASSEYAYTITTDSSGNVLVGGLTDSMGNNQDVLILKLNSSGNITWQVSIGGGGSNYLKGITTDSSNNVYGVGFMPDGHGYLVKLNSSGAVQWQRTLSGASYDYLYGVKTDSSGNVYICGNTQDANYNAVLAKYDSSGTLQWQKKLTGDRRDEFFALAIDSSSNIYTVGQTENEFVTSLGLIVKYNSSGTVQWQRTLNADNLGTKLTGIALNSAGTIMYITGTASNNTALCVKLPTDGSLTGTYSGFAYAASSLTPANATLTSASVSYYAATPALVAGNTSFTEVTSTFTTTNIPVTAV